jgi:hypothetical protein
MDYVSNLAQNHLTSGDVLLQEFILVMIQLKENDSDVDPANLY